MNANKFTPHYSGNVSNLKQANQRYRHAFGDKRLEKRCLQIMTKMEEHQQSRISKLSTERKEVAGMYRFFENSKVRIDELIHQCCIQSDENIRGKDILVLLDSCSIGLRSKGKERERWAREIGVVDDNRTPVIHICPSLVLDKYEKTIYGIGELIVYSRRYVKGNKQTNRKQRRLRGKLPFVDREGSLWYKVATETHRRIESAREITYIIDQGGDKYESLEHILHHTGSHIVVRTNGRRHAQLPSGAAGRLSDITGNITWSEMRQVHLRGLHHYSKSRATMVQRTERTALLKIRYTPIELCRPEHYTKDKRLIQRPLWVVEVSEDVSTVPQGESPIRWQILTTWEIDTVDTAWKVIEAYQLRWTIEQLFRIFKKQGFDIEATQMASASTIKKQAVMALTASTKALQLVQARDGKSHIPIETMFSLEEQQLLEKLNTKLSTENRQVRNRYDRNSLAWAAWIIARLGNWSGYESQRPPGPTSMLSGLEKFYTFCELKNLLNDDP